MPFLTRVPQVATTALEPLALNEGLYLIASSHYHHLSNPTEERETVFSPFKNRTFFTSLGGIDPSVIFIDNSSKASTTARIRSLENLCFKRNGI